MMVEVVVMPEVVVTEVARPHTRTCLTAAMLSGGGRRPQGHQRQSRTDRDRPDRRLPAAHPTPVQTHPPAKVGHTGMPRLRQTKGLGLLPAGLLSGVCVVAGGEPAPDAASAPAVTAETIVSSLNASIDWYRDARVTMREVNRTGALFAAEDQETARQALQRAFAVARARAALLKQNPDA